MNETDAADFVERARALRPLIEGSGDEIARGRRLTAPVVAALVDGGFYRMLLPRSLGGAELPPPVFMQVLLEIATADASTAWCLGQCGVCAMIAAYLDRDAAREIFAARPGILAWGQPAPVACRVEGGYRVTGSWTFASGCRQAGWLGAHVPVIAADGAAILRTMLFPVASATLHDVWDVIGLKGTGTDNYSVSDLFVPERFSAARDDPAERREAGPLYRFSTATMFALGFAAVALGVARAMLDAATGAARGKKSSGVKHAMRDNHAVQSQIGRCEARLRCARAYLFGCAEEIWRDLARASALTMEHRIAIRLASTWTIHEAAAVVDAAYHMMGATSVFGAQPFERRFRDIHAIAQQAQARDIHYESVGQFLLGLEMNSPIFVT